IRVERNIRDNEFLYLMTVIVTAAVYWVFDSMLRLATSIPSYPSRTGQVSGLILHLSIWQSHMFLLNSRLGRFTAASPTRRPEEAPLLPKLQGHFAEFLSHDSLEHLRILSSTTCVGLRYGFLQPEA